MGKPTGFLEFTRELPKKRDPQQRVHDYREIEMPFSEQDSGRQAARCMDCGTPFCHSGCPLGNIIPEFNDAVYEQNWAYAYEILASTNNFPEFTAAFARLPARHPACWASTSHPLPLNSLKSRLPK